MARTRLLVTGDWHLTDNPRDAYRHKLIAKLTELVAQLGADALVILGDLTEDKDRHDAGLVNLIASAIYQLCKICPLYIMRGNHDYLDADNPFFGFLEFFSDPGSVHWINNPMVPSSGPITKFGEVLFLPHTRDYVRDWRDWQFEKCDLIFAHNTFQGAKSESGKSLDGIPLDVFPEDAMVISGDVHVPQSVGPVTYVGAPYTIDFGDDFAPRMLLLEAEGRRRINERSIDLSGEPQKVLIDIKRGSKYPDVRSGDIVSMRVHLPSDKFQEWPNIKAQAERWAEAAKVELFQVRPVVEKVSRPLKGSRDRSRRSDEDVLKSFCSSRQLDGNVAKTGQWIMEQG